MTTTRRGSARGGLFGRVSGSDDSGAAAVEFALVSLLLITLFLGIIEFSLILRDKVAVTSAVRAGGRVASSLPRLAMGADDPATNTFKTDNVAQLVPDAVKAVATAATGIPKTSINEVWVYEAKADGMPLSGSLATCAANCVRYRWNPTRSWKDGATTVIGGFERISGSWPAAGINACVGTQQSVGVQLKVNHPYLFGLFGKGSITISDNSTFRFEPVPSIPGPCK